MKQLAEVAELQTKVGMAIEQHLNEQGNHSKNTERDLRSDMQRFIKDRFGKDFSIVTAGEMDSLDYDKVMEYRKNMMKSLANSTVNRHMSTIKTTIKHLKGRNLIQSDVSYLDTIKRLPEKTEEIEYMPIELVDKYIEEAGKEKYNAELKQNVIRFAADTGLRLEEVVSVELKQFTVDGDTVILKGYGKGNKEYIDRISINLYNQLLNTMTTTDNYNRRLFAPLSEKVVKSMMKRIQKGLNLEDKNYSFHSLKKTAVTNTYRATGCILAAQRKGRHSDINTTRRYLKEEDFGITGVYSMRSMGYDNEAYKKVSYEVLLKTLSEMNKDFLHILNMKLHKLNN
ncbi:tyrosine-type recombinase/integrase [Sporosarcina sp. FSL W7-1283]|uniref:tyrosine-type recombinase/integrase n=1 Tax=Sporosarcina sp. FSL W7-1283 TaxID=2921560 RepID=UPI0030F90689